MPVLLGAQYRTTVESTANPGESYYHDGFGWTDLYDYEFADPTWNRTANFCIKALTGIHRLGDLNCDNSVNELDIDAFVLTLLSGPDFAEYSTAYPHCDPLLADHNGDGSINGLDIDPFIQAITQ